MTAIELVTLADEKARANGYKWTTKLNGRIVVDGEEALCPLEVAGDRTQAGTAWDATAKLGLTDREATIIMQTADNIRPGENFSLTVRILMVETFDFVDGARPTA